MNFADLIPANTFTDILGDDLTYHAPTGPVTIKGMFNPSIEPVFSGEAHIPVKRKQLDVAKADVPGLKKGSKFTIGGSAYKVDDIIGDDGQFLKLVLV